MPLTGTAVIQCSTFITGRGQLQSCLTWRNPDAFAMLQQVRQALLCTEKAIRKRYWMNGSALILASTFVSGFDASLFFLLCNIKIVALINFP